MRSAKMLGIRDELHGDIAFSPLLRRAIDHRYVQRLRGIRQAGLAEYVFPGASHNRFQHSLGVSYLASYYFEKVVDFYGGGNIPDLGMVGDTEFHVAKTQALVEKVAEDRDSLSFWKHVVGLAGLLHDVGHGPWSHTFEALPLQQDFSEVLSKLPASLRTFLVERSKENGKWMHEDLSVLYIFLILEELDAGTPGVLRYFLPVSLLVHGKMPNPQFEAAMAEELSCAAIAGGVEVHRLLRPLLSGPFDVDRMDYLQRDGRNCGVSLGNIEWRRITSKVMPCLARHPNSEGDSEDVVLVTHFKNRHVLDDFVFSLSQMYAQVYLHPKIVGLEEQIKRMLLEGLKTPGMAKKLLVTLESHARMSDDSFARAVDELGITSVRDLLLRSEGTQFQAIGLPITASSEEWTSAGFSSAEGKDRPMFKDTMGVFLYSEAPDGQRWNVRSWADVSPIVRSFRDWSFSPNIFVGPTGAGA